MLLPLPTFRLLLPCLGRAFLRGWLCCVIVLAAGGNPAFVADALADGVASALGLPAESDADDDEDAAAEVEAMNASGGACTPAAKCKSSTALPSPAGRPTFVGIPAATPRPPVGPSLPPNGFVLPLLC
jgi:hypothetical protein